MQTNINISKFWTRIGAFLIDGVILGAFGYLLGLTIQDFLVQIGNYGLLFGLAITVIYQTICNSKIMNGQTIGKRALNIQVVDINGNTISIGKSFVRALILSFPYFTANLNIPGVPLLSPLEIIKSAVLYSVLVGIVIIYIFNKGTRQALHDLIVGTYVVNKERLAETITMPAVTKTSFYAFGGVMALLIGFSIFIWSWVNPELKNLGSVREKVLSINGVIEATVTKGTTYGNGSPTGKYQVKLWVAKLPNGKLENEEIVREAAMIALNNVPGIDSIDVISISLTREFNIGIASQKFTKTVSDSPQRWREVLK